MVLEWGVKAVAKAGTISLIGVYGKVDTYPIGDAFEKNVTLMMAIAIIDVTCHI